MGDFPRGLVDLGAVAKSVSHYYSDFRRAANAEGKVEGKAESVVMVLEARGVALRADERERILACTDRERLDVWLRRSVRVESAAELSG
ncbi:hypothetical protein GCM10022254_19590 [Actinomadura meridiana]|uniref:Uncharacterized protein n=1 Tax=Actinomadura meridiana TaxID=559626 RepID=A0ABP8BXT1_9ACTN